MQSVLSVGRHSSKVVIPSFIMLFLALLAAPTNLLSVFAIRGSYVPVVSLFLSLIKQQALPPGLRILIETTNEMQEVYILAAIILSLMLSSPLIAYAIFARLIPRGAANRRRRIFSLVALASVVFSAGASIAFYLLPAVFTQDPGLFQPVFSSQPFVDAATFYILNISLIALGSLIFVLPVYVAVAVLHRRRAKIPTNGPN
jgi:Sec-independent protein secretion pathway component TatC